MQDLQTYVSKGSSARVPDVVGRMRAEYDEMPGMYCTPEQAQQLCVLGPDDIILPAMVDAGFPLLPAGGYVRG